MFMGNELYAAHRLPDKITAQTAVLAVGVLSLFRLSGRSFPIQHSVTHEPSMHDGDMLASMTAGIELGAHILLADEATHVTALRIAHMLEQAGVKNTIAQIAARMSQSAAVLGMLVRRDWYFSLPRRLRIWLYKLKYMHESPALFRVTVSMRDAYMVDCGIHYLHVVNSKSKVATIMTVGGSHLNGVVQRLQQHGYKVVAANVILSAAH
ncbi:hypothetical protein JKP88DRAFT_256217 [Tribonema minus]|uniref:Uncharacterized protein n=1 Tax=Tribonema minus TaxID=303371 RepID=A0A836CC07_9STRA|nr:hypothetical protein JKP88DRAFT_256217 [Tribonema minus]